MEFFGRGRRTACCRCSRTLPISSSRARRTEPRSGGRRGEPVEFAEAFLRNYPEGQWISRERERLTNAIDRVADNAP